MSCGEVADGMDGEKAAEKLMPKRREVRRVDKTICQRCRTAKSMYVIRSATYCTECFETNVFSRFTRLLYPPLRPEDLTSKKHGLRNLYRPPRQSGNVLIALSGGAGSMIMLDMLLRGGYVGTGSEKLADKTKGEKEVIWTRGYVVYVEYAGVIDGSEERSAWVKEAVEGRGLEFVGLRAEDVYDSTLFDRLRNIEIREDGRTSGQLAVDLRDPILPISPAESSSTPLELLRTLLASLPPPSRPALLSNILHSLLLTASSSLPNIAHVLTGETSTRQAQRVISGTASGRGWALPLELSPSTTLSNGVVRISPMKDTSLKETAFACRIRGLRTMNSRNWARVGPGGGRDSRGKGGVISIEGLTEQFIASLDVTHPATVSTINRTGDKLVFPGQNLDKLCPLCQMPVDPSALEWKSRTALTALDKTPKPTSQPDVVKEGLADKLCYACLTTLTPTSHNRKDTAAGPVELPLWVGPRVAVRREEMRAEVADFLLGDEEEGL